MKWGRPHEAALPFLADHLAGAVRQARSKVTTLRVQAAAMLLSSAADRVGVVEWELMTALHQSTSRIFPPGLQRHYLWLRNVTENGVASPELERHYP